MAEAAKNKEKKSNFIKKIYEKLSTSKSIILVSLPHVSSNQVQQIRKDILAAGAELVIGKNTIVKKALEWRTSPLNPKMEDYDFYKKFGAPMPQLSILKEKLVGKIGMIFSNLSVYELKSIIYSNRREAPAKPGAVSNVEVIIPPGPTGMDPSQISFFHALQISTKINKGQIEIVKDVKVLVPGQTVGASEAALLAKMNLKPFSYGMEIVEVYDEGIILSKKMIDFNPESLIDTFKQGCNNLTALSIETGYVTKVSAPYMIVNAFKNVAAIAMETGYKLAELEAAKNAQVAAPSQTKTAAPVQTKEAAKVVEAPVEVEEEVDMGDLFGDF